MSKSWTIIEKIIGSLQIIVGGVMIYVLVWWVLWDFNYVVCHASLPYTWRDISVIKVALKYHFPLLLCLLTVFSGVMLLFGKRAGWITGLVTSPVVGLIAFNGAEYTDWLRTPTHYTIMILVAVIWFLFFVLLLLKPFRVKYYSRKTSLIAIAAIIVVFIVDLLIFKK